jgi:predicted ATPase
MTAVETTKEKWWEAEVYRTAGEIALQLPVPDAVKAQAYVERALTVAREQQAKSWELRAPMSMRGSGAIRASGMRHASFSRRSNGWFTEGFDTLDLKAAKALLDELETLQRISKPPLN